MLAILNTAERAGGFAQVNQYVLSRHLFAYVQAIEYIGDVVLELGCGNGYGMNLLADRCLSYTAIDKCLPGKLQLNAKTALFKSKLPFLGNIGNNSFDTVICFQVIEHIKNDSKLLSEIYRVLKPGGKLLLTTPNIDMSLTRNPYHIREYNTAAIERQFANVFDAFTVYGVKGNNKVMEYYGANKTAVDRIMRWDVLNLQHRLPAGLLKLPYNIFNNLNRWYLYQQQGASTNDILHSDFYLSHGTDACLDFFVVALKQ